MIGAADCSILGVDLGPLAAVRSPTWSRISSRTTTTRLHIARGLRPDSPAELPAATSAPLTNNAGRNARMPESIRPYSGAPAATSA
jgi:hypothetical protein